MCNCKHCPIIKEIIPFHQKWVAPASKRAWENTKYNFHAGYSKACKDLSERMDKVVAEQVKK